MKATEIETLDVLSLGMMADEARRARHGRRVTFVRVATFDAARPLPDPSTIPAAAGEWRIVGRPPDLDAAVRLAGQLAEWPGRQPLTGFSLGDIDRVALASGRTLAEALLALHDAGLEAIADVPVDRFPHLEAALGAVRQAGMQVGRLTLEDAEVATRVALLRRVAETAPAGVVTAMAPLPRLVDSIGPTTGYDDVKIVAMARLMLESIPSIQIDWSVYGPKLAQVALTFGADDVDLVSPVDEVPEGRRRAPLEEVRRNIIAGGLEPVERDGRYAARG